jgi:hypothetical protein
MEIIKGAPPKKRKALSNQSSLSTPPFPPFSAPTSQLRDDLPFFMLKFADGPYKDGLFIHRLPVVLGRTALNNANDEEFVKIAAKTVSRRHATISWVPSRRCYELEVTGRNAVIVSRQRVNQGDRAVLQNRSAISLGVNADRTLRFHFLLPIPPSPARSATAATAATTTASTTATKTGKADGSSGGSSSSDGGRWKVVDLDGTVLTQNRELVYRAFLTVGSTTNGPKTCSTVDVTKWISSTDSFGGLCVRRAHSRRPLEHRDLPHASHHGDAVCAACVGSVSLPVSVSLFSLCL